MTEIEKKDLEEEIVLRERGLALHEKEFALTMKRWRLSGSRYSLIAVLCCCIAVVGVSGWKFWNLSDKLSPSLILLQEKEIDGNDGKRDYKTNSTPLRNGELRVVFSSNGQPKEEQYYYFIMKAEDKLPLDQWALVLVLTINGILILTGLGISASMVRLLAKSIDDD